MHERDRMVATTGVQRPNDEQAARIGRSRGICCTGEEPAGNGIYIHVHTGYGHQHSVQATTTGDVMWMGYEPTSSSEGINTHMKHKRILRLKRQ